MPHSTTVILSPCIFLLEFWGDRISLLYERSNHWRMQSQWRSGMPWPGRVNMPISLIFFSLKSAHLIIIFPADNFALPLTKLLIPITITVIIWFDNGGVKPLPPPPLLLLLLFDLMKVGERNYYYCYSHSRLSWWQGSEMVEQRNTMHEVPINFVHLLTSCSSLIPLLPLKLFP